MKNQLFLVALMLGFIVKSNAQVTSSNEIIIAPMVSISVENNISTVKEGEHLILKAKGGDEFSILQWQVSADNKTWQNIPKANGNIYETLPIESNSFFRVAVSPIDAANNLKVETLSNVQTISLESNVASTKKKKD